MITFACLDSYDMRSCCHRLEEFFQVTGGKKHSYIDVLPVPGSHDDLGHESSPHNRSNRAGIREKSATPDTCLNP